VRHLLVAFLKYPNTNDLMQKEMSPKYCNNSVVVVLVV